MLGLRESLTSFFSWGTFAEFYGILEDCLEMLPQVIGHSISDMEYETA